MRKSKFCAIDIYVYIYLYIYICMFVGTLRALNPLVTDLQVSRLIWALGTELHSSEVQHAP